MSQPDARVLPKITQCINSPIIATMKIERENGERWVMAERLCVVRTVASMAAEINNQVVKVSDAEVNLRREQLTEMRRLYANHIERLKSELGRELTPPVVAGIAGLTGRAAHLDQWAIRNYIQEIMKMESETGKVLEGCEIKMVRGNMREVLEYIKEGYQVGVKTLVVEGNMAFYHLYHLVVDANGNYFSISDGEEPQFLAEKGQERELDFFMGLGATFAKGWNLLLIRKADRSERPRPRRLRLR